jgi:hypothetical protein
LTGYLSEAWKMNNDSHVSFETAVQHATADVPIVGIHPAAMEVPRTQNSSLFACGCGMDLSMIHPGEFQPHVAHRSERRRRAKCRKRSCPRIAQKN